MSVMRTSEAEARFGRGVVRHAVSSGRWQRPARGVVVTHNGPIDREERAAVALAVCAPGSALAGLSGLSADGFTGFETDDIFVVLPEGADKPRCSGLITRWSTELSSADVHPVRHPRRTRPPRSAVDAAAWCASDRYARAIVIAAVQQGLVPHQRDVAWSGDLFRTNEITIAGPRLLFFSSYAVRREQRSVGDQLLRMFHAQGWQRAARPNGR